MKSLHIHEAALEVVAKTKHILAIIKFLIVRKCGWVVF